MKEHFSPEMGKQRVLKNIMEAFSSYSDMLDRAKYDAAVEDLRDSKFEKAIALLEDLKTAVKKSPDSNPDLAQDQIDELEEIQAEARQFVI